jgi:transposase-like protein
LERRRRVDQALFAVVCADLDQEVGAFRDRSLSGQNFPYVFLDATYCSTNSGSRRRVPFQSEATDGHESMSTRAGGEKKAAA